MNEFDELEKALARKGHEEQAVAALEKAAVNLTLGRRFQGDRKTAESLGSCVFFSTLAVRLKRIPDWEVPTMAVDGKNLLYNPEFVCGLTPDELVGVFVHEVLHLAQKHHARQQPDARKDNVAADLAVNSILTAAGFRLPACALLPGKRPLGQWSPAWAEAIGAAAPDLSKEEYYRLLPDEEGGEGAGEGAGEGGGKTDPGGCGSYKKPGDGSESARKQAEADADMHIAEAQQAAERRGTLSGGLARMVTESLEPVVDWKQVLREFVARQARNDYTWSRPNRRFIGMGIYLPGLHSEELGDVVAAVDTSGTISKEMLAKFSAELSSILASYDCALTILYHDAAIRHVQQWRSSDGPLVMEAVGGGGTSHVPVFDWIAEQGVQPDCLVCLTDMYSAFPQRPPEYPVLWASTGGKTAPFGQLVEVK